MGIVCANTHANSFLLRILLVKRKCLLSAGVFLANVQLVEERYAYSMTGREARLRGTPETIVLHTSPDQWKVISSGACSAEVNSPAVLPVLYAPGLL